MNDGVHAVHAGDHSARPPLQLGAGPGEVGPRCSGGPRHLVFGRPGLIALALANLGVFVYERHFVRETLSLPC